MEIEINADFLGDNLELDSPSSTRYMKRSDVRRIMNYIRNKKKKVRITDEQNNSMELNTVRTHIGIVESYKLTNYTSDAYCEYSLNIKFTDGYEMEIWLDTQYELLSKFGSRNFVAGYINGGPWCYFTIIPQ